MITVHQFKNINPSIYINAEPINATDDFSFDFEFQGQTWATVSDGVVTFGYPECARTSVGLVIINEDRDTTRTILRDIQFPLLLGTSQDMLIQTVKIYDNLSAVPDAFVPLFDGQIQDGYKFMLTYYRKSLIAINIWIKEYEV
jgi:hypothetical protein